ncbi:MAG: hypothetical protein IH600_06865 [Bacteroidetes bacterium]|nr:hypothetical protein [Bacteroidota bacterium]
MSAIPVLDRMHARLGEWSAAGDKRDVFLRCYSMMTANMHAGIDGAVFRDADWVWRLLGRFAEYYFEALDQWERDPVLAPKVWQLAHESTRRSDATILQHLLLGVNAHINYDLVLTVAELLDAEWPAMTHPERDFRYDDYCRVNAVIADTIDQVQDEVIAPAMPLSAVFDVLLGRLDEMLISRMIASWRDRTWVFAVRLLEAPDPAARQAIVAEVEESALRMAQQLSAGMKHG